MLRDCRQFQMRMRFTPDWKLADRGWSLNVGSTDLWRLQDASDANNLVECSFSGMQLDTWTYPVGVYDPDDSDGPVMRLYLNGVLVSTQISGVPAVQHSSGVSVSIGARSDGSTRWRGRIDDVRIYARALTDVEVAAQAPPEFLPRVLEGDQLKLTWTGPGWLQSAAAVTGTYTNIDPQPVSPYTTTVVPGENKFFRLVMTP